MERMCLCQIIGTLSRRLNRERLCRLQEGGTGAELKWVTNAELAAAGLSSVMRKVADRLDAPQLPPKAKQQTLAAFLKK